MFKDVCVMFVMVFVVFLLRFDCSYGFVIWFIGFECFALFPTRFYVLLFLLHGFVLVYNFYIL